MKRFIRLSIALLATIFSSQLWAQKDLVISGGNTVSSFVCENKTAFVWGSNAAGQLGLHDAMGNPITTNPINTPTAITRFNGLASPPDVKQINSGSGSHFVALTCTGDVWAWGVNGRGQIGIGANTPSVVTIPTRVIANAAVDALYRGPGNVLRNASVVYSGTVNSFAILQNGDLVSWGGGSGTDTNPSSGLPAQAGQLGQGPANVDAYTANYVMINATTRLTDVVQIFAGDNVAYALVDTDGDGVGTVYSWGFGLNGTLGRDANGTSNPLAGGTVQSSYARPVYYANGTQMNNIQQLQAGDVFGIALDVNNYVWTWGNGYWNNSTGNAPTNTTSEPRRVIAGGTTGASNDGTYLLAKAVGGGQGFGMAVTLDGKPVAWGGGGCTDGGAIGNGTLGGSTTGPQYIKYGPGATDIHTNVTLINRGDTWGFYGTANNQLYAWGCNALGQLGIGNIVSQQYATLITPPTGCSLRDPAPTVNLSPGSAQLCLPFSSVLNSGFVPNSGKGSSYNINWYKDDVLIASNSGLTNVASRLTYTATDLGEYKVVVSYVGTAAGCSVYEDAKDSIVISTYTSNFNDPGDLTFCGTTSNVRVTETGASATATGSTYEWYKDQVGGTALATTTDAGTATLTVSTLAMTGTAPNRTATVWVEDKSTFNATLATSAQVGASSLDGNNKTGNGSRLTFSVARALQINTIRINLRVYDQNATNWSFGIYNSAGVLQGTSVPFTAGVGSIGNVWSTVSFGGLALSPGNYYIQYINGNSGVSFYQNPGSAYTALYQYNGQTVIDFISTDNPGVTTYFPAYVDWNVTVGSPYPCGRLAVKITEDCPPCNKPNSITMGVKSTSNDTLCVGQQLRLEKLVIDTTGKASTKGGYYYYWSKKLNNTAVTNAASKYSNLTLAATGVYALKLNAPSAAYADYSKTSVIGDDSGYYYLVIQDGPGNNASCKDSVGIRIRINKKPTVRATIERHQDLCKGTAANPITQKTASTGSYSESLKYQWYSTPDSAKATPTYTKIASATGITYNPGTPTSTIYYIRRDSVSYCAAVATNHIEIRVNNKPTSFAIRPKAPSNDTLCVNSTLTLEMHAIDTALSKSTSGKGYYYYWTKRRNGVDSVLTTPKKLLNPPTGGYADYTIASVAAKDSGMYYLVIQDGLNTKPSCKDSVGVRIKINRAPQVAAVIEKDQYLCKGSAAVAITQKTASTGSFSEQLKYQWYSKDSAVATPKFTKIASATGISYNPGTPTSTLYYARKDSVSYCPAKITNLVLVKVDNKPLKAKLKSAVRDTLCVGEDFNITASYLATDTTGANASVNKGYRYYWRKYQNNVLVNKTAEKTFAGSKDYLNALSTPEATRAVVEADSGLYWFVVEDGINGNKNCKDSVKVRIVVQTPITTAAEISASDTICSGTQPVKFVEKTAASGQSANAKPLKYQWVFSTDSFKTAPVNTTLITLKGKTKDYQEPNTLTANRYYMRIDSAGYCGTSLTNIITIKVDPAVVAGVIAPDASVCSGRNVDSIYFTTKPTGGRGTGTYTYKWFSSETSASAGFTEISGETNAKLIPTSITKDTWYYVEVSSGVCASQKTIAVKISVTGNADPGKVAPVKEKICYNTVPSFTFTETVAPQGGTGGTGPAPSVSNPVYQWYVYNKTTGVYDIIPGATSSGHKETAALTDTTKYRRLTVQGTTSCDSGYVEVQIDVTPELNAGTIGNDVVICEGKNASVKSLTKPTGGGDNVYTYRWIYSEDNGLTWVDSTGATEDSLRGHTLYKDRQYKRIVSNAACSSSDTTNAVTITVTAINPLSVVLDTDTLTSCAGPVALTATTVGTGNFKWYRINYQSTIETLISGVTGSSYNFTAVLADSGARIIVEYTTTDVCKKGSGIVRDTAVLVITDQVTPKVTISSKPSKVCEGLPIDFKIESSTGGGTAPTYEWYVKNSTGTTSLVGTGTTYTETAPVAGDSVYVVMTSNLACVVAGSNPATSNKIYLDVRKVPAPVINESNQEFCSGNSFTYTVTVTNPSNKLQWKKDGVNISGATSISYVATQSGVYTLTEDNGACATTTTGVTVEVVATPSVYAGEDQYVIDQSLVQLNASGATNYVWTPNTGLSSDIISNPTFIATQTITYMVSGTNVSVSGNTTCTGSDEVTVVVVRPIKIPNAISPNGDNVNDDWVIENIEGFPNCEVEVYNRYGSLVWKSTGYKTNWAGVNFRNGEVLPDGTYFYVIDLKSEVFKDPYKGYIQIVK